MARAREADQISLAPELLTGTPSEDGDGLETGNSALLHRLKRLFRLDRQASAAWRKEAKEDFDFVAGEQWSQEDQAHLKTLMRPIITFNRIIPVINAVSGQEITNRQEARYVPREEGDVKPNELLTEAARWFRDEAQADDEDSEAFLNSSKCGMGWTETTLDYEKEDYGCPKIESINPMEMFWDCNARKKNLVDAERVWRVRKMSLARARDLFPGKSAWALDARWAANEIHDGGQPTNADMSLRYEDQGIQDDTPTDDTVVTLVHCEWKTRGNVYTVADQGQSVELSEDEYKTLTKRAKEIGVPVFATKKTKTQVKQAFLGNEVLQYSDGLCGDHFRYGCVTAYRDENKGSFFGIVRAMKDPQRWANKWLSQTLDLMNSQVKGGIIIEADAVEDMREFQRTWAKADQPTVVKRGALSGPNKPKLQPKPVAQFPASFFQMMEFAVQSTRDVTGISVEMLGLREADQPASLEFQRRQAGMTILAPLFQNLKRYRHDQARVMLYLIQNYMSDGRLVRVLGESQAQYLPLIKQADLKYDIIIDDMPSSPNQKEMVWAMVGERIWELPPPIQLALLKYSPFPTTVVEEIRKAADSMSQSPQAQLQMQMQQLENALTQMTAMLKQAQTVKTMAEAQQIQQETAMGGEGADPSKMVKAQGELAIKSQESQNKIQIEREKLKLKGAEMQMDAQLQQQQQGFDQQLQGAQFQFDQQRANAEMQMQERQMQNQQAMQQQDQGFQQNMQARQFAGDERRAEQDQSMQRQQQSFDQNQARQGQAFDQRQASSQQKFDQGMAKKQATTDKSLAQQKLKQQAAKPKPSGGKK